MATRTVRRRAAGPVDLVTRRFFQFLTFQAEEASAKKNKDDIKKELTAIVDEHHEVDEEKGHLLHTLPDPIEVGGKQYTGFMKQRKVSQVFLEDEAEHLCREKGFSPEEYMTPVLDQDKIARLYAEDKISDEEFDSLFENKEIFAFVPVKA